MARVSSLALQTLTPARPLSLESCESHRMEILRSEGISVDDGYTFASPGKITVAGSGTIISGSGANVFNVTLAGSSGLSVSTSNGASVEFGASNSYTGQTVVSGILRIAPNGNL